MVDKPKFQQKRQKKDVDVSRLDEFADKAGKQDKGPYPWNDPSVREDFIKMIPLYLSEPYRLKLRFLSETSKMPQQEILREILLPEIDARINQEIEKKEKKRDK